MIHTTNTQHETTPSERNPQRRSGRRLAVALIAVAGLVGSLPGLAGAESEVPALDFVQCIPTEFSPCETGPIEPEPDPDPGPAHVSPTDELVFCGNDMDGVPECPDEGEPPVNVGEIDAFVHCMLVDGVDPCDEDGGENPGEGEGEGEGPDVGPEEPGDIDEPVPGNPDFTG